MKGRTQKTNPVFNVDGIEFKVIFSRRRTLGLSVLPDTTVIVRAPYFTTGRTIEKVIRDKSGWILKHKENYRKTEHIKGGRQFTDGEIHLFRGRELNLKCVASLKPYLKVSDNTIEAGLPKYNDPASVQRLIERWYREEAGRVLPEIFAHVLSNLGYYEFKPSGLVLRSMRRRWGSCSSKGIITLSTELIKLPDKLIEYVIIHELCHLQHHNHGSEYYTFLSVVCPDYKDSRKELRRYIP